MTLAPDAIFRTVLKGIPSAKGKRDGKPVPNHRPFKSLRNNVSRFVLLRFAVIVAAIEKTRFYRNFLRLRFERSSNLRPRTLRILTTLCNCATWDLFIAAKLLELVRLGLSFVRTKLRFFQLEISLTRNEQHGR